MLCHYWYFKDVGFRFEPHVCNKCYDQIKLYLPYQMGKLRLGESLLITNINISKLFVIESHHHVCLMM